MTPAYSSFFAGLVALWVAAGCSEDRLKFGTPTDAGVSSTQVSAGGGTCVGKVYDSSCSCEGTGDACEVKAKFCPDHDCQNQGKCVEGASGFSCNCDDTDYEGDRCEEKIDDCKRQPCGNGGQCEDKIRDFACNCADTGFEGKSCRTDVNECARGSHNCDGNATCTNTTGSFTCACNSGFSGDGVSCTEIDECKNQPCGAGTCQDQVNGFACDCSGTGFEGKSCQVNIDDCKPNPCDNGGRCIDETNDYTCECKGGFSGKRCDTKFEGIGESPLGSCSSRAISGDGQVVLCSSGGSSFRWTNGQFTLLDGGDGAAELNEDGSVVVGDMAYPLGPRTASRWSGTATPIFLSTSPDVPPPDASTALAVSASGNVIAGMVFGDIDRDEPGRLVRWVGGGFGTIIDVSQCDPWTRGMSSDGNVIFGDCGDSPGGWSWTPTAGVSKFDGILTGANRDGSVIVGSSGGMPVTWNNGSTTPRVIENLSGTPSAISDEASIVAGTGPSGPFVWHETNGSRLVVDILTEAGLDLSGWRLSSVTDLSYDGKVLLGRGDKNGVSTNWVAYLSTD